MKSSFDVRTKWTSGCGSGKEVRYYGLVEAGGKSLVEILVSGGLARFVGPVVPLPSDEKSTAYRKRLAAMESDARKQRVGVWAHSTK